MIFPDNNDVLLQSRIIICISTGNILSGVCGMVVAENLEYEPMSLFYL